MNLTVYCAVEPRGYVFTVNYQEKKIMKCMPNQNLLHARMAMAIPSE